MRNLILMNGPLWAMFNMLGTNSLISIVFFTALLARKCLHTLLRRIVCIALAENEYFQNHKNNANEPLGFSIKRGFLLRSVYFLSQQVLR